MKTKPSKAARRRCDTRAVLRSLVRAVDRLAQANHVLRLDVQALLYCRRDTLERNLSHQIDQVIGP